MTKTILLTLSIMLSGIAFGQSPEIIAEIKSDPLFKNYLTVFQSWEKSILNDDWHMHDPQVKTELEKAKQNGTTATFYKSLKNKDGISYYDANMQLMEAYAKLYTKYVKQGKVDPKNLKQAISETLRPKT
jgi:hypothetical protein